MSRSKRQYVWWEHDTYIMVPQVLVPVLYLVLLLHVQKNAQHRTTQHRNTNGEIRHRTIYAALHCWAVYSRADLSWGCIVIQQRINSMYKQIISTGTWDDPANVTDMHKLIRVPQSTQHGKAAKHVNAALLRAVALRWGAGRCGADEPSPYLSWWNFVPQLM